MGEHGFEEECQTLVFSGKVLKPDDAVPVMGEGSFMVLMMKKAKKKTPPQPAASKPAESTEAGPSEIPDAPAPATPPLQPEVQPPIELSQHDSAPPAEGTTVENEAAPPEEMVAMLKEMGFDEQQVVLALRLANNN